MNPGEIHKAFSNLIAERGVYTTLGISSGAVRQYRHALKNGIEVSLQKKIDLLAKAGRLEVGKTYSRADLISLLRFYESTSAAAREEGPEYVVEKWERSKKS